MNVLLHVYMCTMCVPGAHVGQKKASDPWENQSYVGINYPVGAWNQIRVF